MKTVSSAVLATVLMVSSMVIPAMAQTNGRTMLVVNVPFEFTTANGTLPAGEYALIRSNPTSDQAIIQFRNTDGHSNALLQMRPVDGNMQNASQLIFTHIGDRYFLSEMWIAGTHSGLQALKSNAEREEASVRKPSERVAVALSAAKR